MSAHDISVETVTEEFDTNRQLVLGGAAVAVVALFLPWVTASAGPISVSVNGLDLFPDGSIIFNGVVTAVLGVAAAALLFQREWTEETQKYVLAIGGVIAALGLIMVLSPETAFGSDFSAGGSGAVGVDIGTGIGVYATVVAGALIAAGGYLAFNEDGDAGLGS